MKIVLLGAPGSGKGTISYLLSNKNGFRHISTGNLFRKELQNNTELATDINNYIHEGKLVPDSLTNTILKNEISEYIKESKSIIFDGYPRNINQASFLSNISKIDIVIYLEINEDIIIKRTTGRRNCPTCERIYNIYNEVLENKNLCNFDKTILIQRKDDDLETVKERIKVYKDTLKPLIIFYEEQKILYKIDANKDIDFIYNKIIKIIREKNNDHN